jgi:hypothetical protein
MNNEQEILVHISTPATRQNDDLYRSLADAYLRFEPREAKSDGSRFANEESRIVPNVTTSNDSYGSFPSHMGSGNRSSSQNPADAQAASPLGEESQLPTSRLERLERIQARWRQTASRPSLANVQRSSTIAPSSALSDGAFIDDTQLAHQAMESQVLHHGSATLEDTSDDESAVVRLLLAESAGNPQIFRSPTKSKTPNSSKSMEVNQAPSRVASSDAIIRTGADSKPPTLQVQSPEPSPGWYNFESLPLEIYPPAPPVTVLSPGTVPSQITGYLETLKKENPNRFRPRRNYRALEQDERGCWVFDTSRWPCAIQPKFWASLADHVGSGKLGWGITLHREPAQSSTIGLVRLYCWGEVVEHIWLALWMCSDGKISVSGSKWVDAEEMVVLEVTES